MLHLVPVKFADARRFVEELHRHHKAPPYYARSVARTISRWIRMGGAVERMTMSDARRVLMSCGHERGKK